MVRLLIPAIAVTGILWNIDPVLRPYIDFGIWLLFAGLMFRIGVALDDWLVAFASRPYWKKVRRPKKGRRTYSGASIPLLER